MEQTVPHEVPIYFHNMSGFDGHFLLRNLHDERIRQNSLNMLCVNTEKFVSLNFNSFRINDSFSFLKSSLANLWSLLKAKRDSYFPIIRESDLVKTDGKFDETKYNLIVKNKGIYPYDFFTSFDDFELTELPSKEKFYNQLTENFVSDEDYSYAVEIFAAFKCKNLRDFTNIYVKSDCLLLAEIWQNFRFFCYENFELWPEHFVSMPALCYQAALKHTGVQLELITDVDIYLFFETALRGGFCSQMQRFAISRLTDAEREQVGDAYDEYVENCGLPNLLYIDANNLYGRAQCFNLPTGEFEWLKEEDVKLLEERMVAKSSFDNKTRASIHKLSQEDYGCFLEVDIEYPDEIKEKTKSFPLCIEKKNISPDMLSDFQTDLFKSIYHKKTVPVTSKLIGSHLPKEKYIIHGELLELYLELGIKVTKVHRVLTFRQSDFMFSWVEMCTKQRAMADNAFYRNLWKLSVNSVYGKFIEDVRKRTEVRIVRNDYELQQVVRLNRFKDIRILAKDLALVTLYQTKVVLSKPIFVGAAILDFSKLVMFDTYYNHVQPAFGNRVSCVYTDTDSFILKIFSNDVMDEICGKLDYIFDLSNLHETDPHKSNVNKATLGNMKIETGSHTMTGLAALRSKCYSFRVAPFAASQSALTDFKKQFPLGYDKRHKGVKKSNCTFDDYVRTLKTGEIVKTTSRNIRSKDHRLYIEASRKMCLSSYDDKRQTYSCNIHSKPFGYNDEKNEECPEKFECNFLKLYLERCVK